MSSVPVPVPVPVRVADGGTEGAGVVGLLLIVGTGSRDGFPDDVDEPHPTASRQKAKMACRMSISLVHVRQASALVVAGLALRLVIPSTGPSAREHSESGTTISGDSRPWRNDGTG